MKKEKRSTIKCPKNCPPIRPGLFFLFLLTALFFISFSQPPSARAAHEGGGGGGGGHEGGAGHETVCFCHNVNHDPHTICTNDQGHIKGHTKHVNNGEDTLGECQNCEEGDVCCLNGDSEECHCGNGECDEGESCDSCQEDCGECPPPGTCDDGVCTEDDCKCEDNGDCGKDSETCKPSDPCDDGECTEADCECD